MTIYSRFSCLTQDSLQVHVPVRCYELTLKHRLLEQLGGFSHLLMDALTLMPEQGVEWAAEITGLNGQQLQPILQRLHGLGLIDDQCRLTVRAKHLVKCMNSLHGQVRLLWLDGQYKKHNFCGTAALEPVEISEETEFVIRPWQRDGQLRRWPSSNWSEDCERQKNRIWRHPDQYLALAFESFNDCFYEAGFPSQEWELSLRVVDKMPQAVAVNLTEEDLLTGSGCEFRLASPVLCLSTYYSLPRGAPEHLSQVLPADHCRFATFTSHDEEGDTFVPEPTQGAAWVWPSLHPDIREKVIELLFEDVMSISDDAMSAFNREHRIDERWQNLGFDWGCIQRRMGLKGIHLIRGGE